MSDLWVAGLESPAGRGEPSVDGLNRGRVWRLRPVGWCTWLLVLAVVTLSGCGERQAPPPENTLLTPKPYRVNGQWYQPLADAEGFRQRGIASWYGADFHGKPTSSGERYDMDALTAAHKTLPLGTYVLIHNLENGERLTVRVNDRGPFVSGRVIDLSREAARRLGVLGPGTARVEVVALGKMARQNPVSGDAEAPVFRPQDYYSGNFTFQVAAFRSEANAAALLRQLEQTYQNAHISLSADRDKTIYRVRVGHCTDLRTAESYERILIRHGFKDVFVVAE